MSSSTKEILKKVRMMVPPMLEKFHKGQMGRIAVIGGSRDYTGAPFFSANASAHLGADLSYIVCTPAAAPVIKSYSPNLMVSPFMQESSIAEDLSDPANPPTADEVIKPIYDLMDRIHVLVIGPGLGRDPLMQETAKKIIAQARSKSIPLVLDADALQIVNKDPDSVKGWKEVVLTPNVVEFSRLAESLNISLSSPNSPEACEKVSAALGGVCIVQKGAQDYISASGKTLVCDLTGGKKRSGGQGDTLTGCIATFLGWRKAYMDRIWDVEGHLGAEELVMLAAFGGSALTRECSRLAFAEKGRAVQASDVGGKVGDAFLNIIGEKEEKEESKL